MKQKQLFVLIFLLIIPFTNAQDNVLKISPLVLSVGNVRISYEKTMTQKTSLHFQGGYYIPMPVPGFIKNLFDSLDIDIKKTGFDVALDYRIYLNKRDILNDKYFGPYISYNYLVIKYSGEYKGFDAEINGDVGILGVGIIFGKQWISRSNFTIDSFGGVGISRWFLKGSYSTEDPLADFEDMAIDADEELGDIPIIGKRMEFDASSNEVSLKMGFFMPHFRLGFLIGFAF